MTNNKEEAREPFPVTDSRLVFEFYAVCVFVLRIVLCARAGFVVSSDCWGKLSLPSIVRPNNTLMTEVHAYEKILRKGR